MGSEVWSMVASVLAGARACSFGWRVSVCTGGTGAGVHQPNLARLAIRRSRWGQWDRGQGSGCRDWI